MVLDPDWPKGYLNLGNSYMLLGNYEKAIEAYRREIYYSPKSADAFFNLARTYSVIGEETLARKAFDSAVRLDPSLARLWSP